MTRTKLVAKMLDHFNFTTPEQRGGDLPNMMQRMSAALAVAAEAVEELLGPITDDEFLGANPLTFKGDGEWNGLTKTQIDVLLLNRRCRVAKLKSPEVTTLAECPIGLFKSFGTGALCLKTEDMGWKRTSSKAEKRFWGANIAGIRPCQCGSHSIFSQRK